MRTARSQIDRERDFALRKHRGRIFGTFRSLSDSGYIVGPLLLGALTDAYGYTAPLLLTAAMTVASGAVFWLFAREFHQAAPRRSDSAARAQP